MIEPQRPGLFGQMGPFLEPAPELPEVLDDDALRTLCDKDPRWLLKLLDENLERSQKLWEKPLPWFRGSASGELCSRALTLSSMGHRVPFEARVLRIFRTGNAIEDVNVAAMDKAGVLDTSMLQASADYDDPPIKGHVDCVLKRPGTGEAFLGEIKSIKQELFKKLPAEHGVILAGQSPLKDSRYITYLKQWNTYAWAKNIDLEIGFLLFEAKNDQAQKIYWLLRDPDLLEQVMEIRRVAAPYVTSKPMCVAPIPKGFDPLDESRGNACGYCDHRYLCKRLPAKGVTRDEAKKKDAQLRG